MPRFVLDCSVAMTWCFEDEASPETDAILDSLKEEHEAIVPSLWHLEVANVLLNAERHGRTNPKRVSDCVRQLEKLPVTADAGTMKRVFKAIVLLAREHHLSTYDAAYLELAIRETVPLATIDQPLQLAARKAGVVVIPK